MKPGQTIYFQTATGEAIRLWFVTFPCALPFWVLRPINGKWCLVSSFADEPAARHAVAVIVSPPAP